MTVVAPLLDDPFPDRQTGLRVAGLAPHGPPKQSPVPMPGHLVIGIVNKKLAVELA